MDPIRVSEVKRLLVGRETYPIRAAKAVCDYSHVARGWVKAIDLRAKLGRGSEALLEAVDGICKPDAAVGV